MDKSTNRTQKYVKEFDFSVDLNDVFLYGKNGEGYYMNNQKVFKEAQILNKIPCENILKHKKFLSERFELKTIKEIKLSNIISDGLSKYAHQNFKKVNDYLKDTEYLKVTNLKEIDKFKLKILNINE